MLGLCGSRVRMRRGEHIVLVVVLRECGAFKAVREIDVVIVLLLRHPAAWRLIDFWSAHNVSSRIL